MSAPENEQLTTQDAQPTMHEDEPTRHDGDLGVPRRPRRRLLGVGANRVALSLLGVLVIACGFIVGVHVEKGETSDGGSAGAATGGVASRFAALRGGTSSAGKGSGTASTAGAVGAGPGASTGAGRPASGTVAYLAGNTIYVTSAEGNTIKVKTSAATSVTKTVKTKAKGIHPGETVTVTGATSSNGSVSAESISVGG